MRKFLMISLMVVLTSYALAQDIDLPEEGEYLESGELFIEITSSPFGRDGVNYFESSNITLLNFGQFRARYALSESIVLRLGAWYAVDDNQSRISTPDVIQTVTEFSVTPGIEYHFLNENGFTSYVALDLMVSRRTMERESSTSESVSGALTVPLSGNQSYGFNNRGYLGYGAMIAFGADYHFSSRFYVGAEIGFYGMLGTTADIEIDGALYQEGISFFQSGMVTSNSFRLGFKLL